MAPATVLSGRNISEESFAISIVILATPYAVCQPVSLSRSTALLDVERLSWNGELAMERAMAVEETASALESLRDARSCTSSAGGVGVETEIGARPFDLRKRGITEVDEQIKSKTGLASRLIGNVTKALNTSKNKLRDQFERSAHTRYGIRQVNRAARGY